MEATIVSAVAIAVSVVTTIVGAINHKRIRSKCCGKEVVASVDIEATTPPTVAPEPPRRASIQLRDIEKCEPIAKNENCTAT